MSSRTYNDWRDLNTRLRAITARTEYIACYAKSAEGRDVADLPRITAEAELLLSGLVLGSLSPKPWPTSPGIYLLYPELGCPLPVLSQHDGQGDYIITYFGRASFSCRLDPDMQKACFVGPVQFLAQTAKSGAVPPGGSPQKTDLTKTKNSE